MDITSILSILISLFLSLLCCGFWVLIFLLVLGFFLLRRRGKKKVTAAEAVKVAAVEVSQVFVRGKHGLEVLDDDDEPRR